MSDAPAACGHDWRVSELRLTAQGAEQALTCADCEALAYAVDEPGSDPGRVDLNWRPDR